VPVDRDYVVRKHFTAVVSYVGGRLRRTRDIATVRETTVGPGGVTGAGGVEVALDVEVERGAPRCRQVTVRPQAPENEPLTTLSIRVPLDHLLQVIPARL